MNSGELLVRVSCRAVEATDISACNLVETDGRSLPSWEVGSHIDVHLPNGLVRQYSLGNALGQQEGYHIAVLRDPNNRGGSLAPHALQKGDSLRVSLSHNLSLAGRLSSELAVCWGARHNPVAGHD
jgi:vanillate O-demethylase ferredoxin subunit